MLDELLNVLRKIVVKSVSDKKIGSSVFPSNSREQSQESKPLRIPRGKVRADGEAMAKIKDIAKIKIEHKNEKKLREILEKRGLKKKPKSGESDGVKKNPVIQTNYKIPKKKNPEEKDGKN